MKKFVLFVVCLLFLLPSAVAHPGKTDAAGGHWNHSTGEYHYHHGYPEHQHIDGVCPYAYDDKTGESSGTSSSSSSSGSTGSITDFIVTLTVAEKTALAAEAADYGPDAETDFKTKQDAYESGFKHAFEFSKAKDIEGLAYSTGYKEGLKAGEESGYDKGLQEGQYITNAEYSGYFWTGILIIIGMLFIIASMHYKIKELESQIHK